MTTGRTRTLGLRLLNTQELLNLRNQNKAWGALKIHTPNQTEGNEIKIVAERPAEPVFTLVGTDLVAGQMAGTHRCGGGMRRVKKPGVPVPVRSRDKS